MSKEQRQQKIQESAQIISKLNDESEFNESVLKIIKDLGLDQKQPSSSPKNKTEDKVARPAADL
jgi:hypothetical protein